MFEIKWKRSYCIWTVLYKAIFRKKHSDERLERRLFEANTKGQFDRLIKKYKIHYDQNDCIYEFDKEFFKNNKVYIIHNSYYYDLIKRKYRVEKNDNDIVISIYEMYTMYTTGEVKKGYHGDLLAVSKEFAKDVKEVIFQYKEYDEYNE